MHVEVGNTINYHGGLEGYKHSGQGKLRWPFEVEACLNVI
jgi:hypothetical protein